jgi:pimeloyl-ACP methyl ester carboxylesterase
MIEPLESRLLFTSPVDTSGVGLFAADGSPATLDRRDKWIIVHGLHSSSADSGIQSLALAVAATQPRDQVLLLDWATIANAPDNVTAMTDAYAAADAIAAKLLAAKIHGSHVNLMGFSMGGAIIDRLAKDLSSVNRIVAIDPSAPPVQITDSRNHLIGVQTTYAAESKYAIAFYGASYIAASLSADDTVMLTNLPGTQIDQHIETFDVVLRMMRRNASFEVSTSDHISPVFSLRNIMAASLPAWRKNAFAPGFEAQLSCGLAVGFTSSDFEPLDLLYLTRHGVIQHIT